MGFIVNLCKDLKGFGHIVDMNRLANKLVRGNIFVAKKMFVISVAQSKVTWRSVSILQSA